MAKKNDDDDVIKRAEASGHYVDAARRLANVKVGDYRDRREAMAKLTQAERAMVKAFGRIEAEAHMLRISVEVIRQAATSTVG